MNPRLTGKAMTTSTTYEDGNENWQWEVAHASRVVEARAVMMKSRLGHMYDNGDYEAAVVRLWDMKYWHVRKRREVCRGIFFEGEHLRPKRRGHWFIRACTTLFNTACLI
jgi:hypothetical protein